MRSKSNVFFILFLTLFVSSKIYGQCIASPNFGSCAITESFENIPVSASNPHVFGGGTIPVTPFTFPSGVILSGPSPNSINGAILANWSLGASAWGLGNSTVTSAADLPDGSSYLGINNSNGIATFTFPANVTELGLYVESWVGVITLTAFNSSNNVVGTCTVNGTGLASNWKSNFLGFKRSQGDIAKITIGGQFVIMDNLTFMRTSDSQNYCNIPRATFFYDEGTVTNTLIFHPSSANACTPQAKVKTKNAKLYALLEWKGDYAVTNPPTTYAALITVNAYRSYSGNSDLIETMTFPVLEITADKPQSYAVIDFTRNSNLINRFEVTATYSKSGVNNPVVESNLTTEVFYKEELEYDVNPIIVGNTPLVNAQSVSFNGPEATFKWQSVCPSAQAQNYQFQLLRLFNEDGNDPTKLTDETKISSIVDWNKALNIETGSDKQEIALTLAEGVGYYIWRVRPIGSAYPGGIANDLNWGVWSNSGTYTPGVSYLFTQASTTGIPYITSNFDLAKQLDDNRNWIFTRSFIEGGSVNHDDEHILVNDDKNPVTIGEAISYANGLQMAQQQQTRLKTEEKKLVGQTIYDFSGRPALTTLAAPVNSGQLGYISSYIQNTSYESYSAVDFDADPSTGNPDYLNPGIFESVTSEGTGNYYSDAVKDCPEDNVPSAEGYPFSRTTYMRDGTSKPKEQSSPGAVFKLGGGHTVRNYTSGVSDEELIIVFGDEAPDASSVLKSMTTDPNGQVSVSYISKEGKTIATCLSATNAGDTGATNLDGLTPHAAGLDIVQNITNNTPYGEHGLRSFKNIVLAEPTQVTLTYSLTANTFENTCVAFCSTCDYWVHINVINNDDPESVIPGFPVSGFLTPNFVAGIPDCTPNFGSGTFDVLLQPGSYTVERIIEGHQINTASTPPVGATANTPYIDQYVEQAETALYAKYNTGEAIVVDDNGVAITGKDPVNMITFNSLLYPPSGPPLIAELYTLLGLLPSDDVNHVNLKFVSPQGCSPEDGKIIRIPISRCPDNSCPATDVNGNPDFEKYFVDFYNAKYPNGTFSITNILPNYNALQFNRVINNMVYSACGNYNCMDLFNCWKGVVASYDASQPGGDIANIIMPTTSANGMSIPSNVNTTTDFLDLFLNCAGYKIEQINNSEGGLGCGGVTDGYKYHPYKSFYYDGNCELCEKSIYMAVEGNLTNYPNLPTANERITSFSAYLISNPTKQTTITADGIVYNKTINLAELFSKCIKNCVAPGTITTMPSEFTANTTALCNNSCEDRYGEFLSQIKYENEHSDFGPSCDPNINDIDVMHAFQVNILGNYLFAPATIYPDAEFDVTMKIEFLQDYTSTGSGNFNQSHTLINGFALISGNLSFDVTNMPHTAGAIYYNTYRIKAPSTLSPSSESFVNVSMVTDFNSQTKTITANTTTRALFCPGECSIHKSSPEEMFCQAEAMVQSCKGLCNLSVVTDQVTGQVSVGTIQEQQNISNIIGGGYFDIQTPACDGNCLSGYSSTSSSVSNDLEYYVREFNNELEIARANAPSNGTVGSVTDFINDNYPNNLTIQAGSPNFEILVHPDIPSYFDLVVGTGGIRLVYYFNRSKEEGSILQPVRLYSLLYDNIPSVVANNVDPISLGAAMANNPDRSGYRVVNDVYSELEHVYSTLLASGQTTAQAQALLLSEYTLTGGAPAYIKYDGPIISTPGTISCQPICYQLKQVSAISQTILDNEVIEMNYKTCEQETALELSNSIEQQIGSLVELELDKLKELYHVQCIDNITDIFTVSYSVKYHHYTLYYYDRAGNLVKTVPPQGVFPITTLPLDRTLHPDHAFITEYEYNSLGQLVRQKTPDGGQTVFAYDSKARLRFSQNAKQALNPVPTFSYTKYDKLGRITEVGETSDAAVTLAKIEDFEGYPAAGAGTDITVTNYTQPPATAIAYFNQPQRYLQNRVSHSFSDKDGNVGTTNDQVATYYSYDPHGNVEWLIQDVPEMGKNYIGYEYDLISGSVLKVKYNELLPDKFFHRYTYDIDKRVRTIETSADAVFWDKDASYNYYLHGPLKRSVIGNEKVQGLDYVYTLQGWLKGINHTSFANDPGLDGTLIGDRVGRDAYSMILGYHQGDFKSGSSAYNSQTASIGYMPAQTGRDLFNGNISSWISNYDYEAIPVLQQPAFLPADPTGRTFRYDELNRITDARFNTFNNGAWTPSDDYHETFAYDANGNITNLTRNSFGVSSGQTGGMDKLEYKYNYPTSPKDQWKNQLLYVHETAGVTADGSDIEDQQSGNYEYDAIGNLTKDIKEGISNIEWNVYGKIASITKVKPNNDPDIIMEFMYDASGKRVSKKVSEPNGDYVTTYYVSDASGNNMAVYKKTYTASPSATTFKLIEQPIYGSDRIGMRSLANMNVTPNATFTIPDPDLIPSEPTVTTIREGAFNNMLVSDNRFIGNFGSWSYVGGAMQLNTEQSTGAKSYPVPNYVGKVGTNTAIYEDDNGSPIIRSVCRLAVGSSAPLTMVFKPNGSLFRTLGLKNNPMGQSMFMKNPDPTKPNEYYYFTIGTDNQAYFHKFDIASGVCTLNIPLDNSGSYKYGTTMALIEDRTAAETGHNSQLYIKRKANTKQLDANGNYQVDLVRVEINSVGGVSAPINMPSPIPANTDYFLKQSAFESCEMQVSPDGTVLAIAKNLGWLNIFNVPQSFGVILPFSLSPDHTTATAALAGSHVGGSFSIAAKSFDFSGDGNVIYCEARGLSQSNVRRLTVSTTGDLAYDATFNNNNLNYMPFAGDIRRGQNGNIYISNTRPYPFIFSTVQPNYVYEIKHPSTVTALWFGADFTVIDVNSTTYPPANRFTVTGGLSLNRHLIYNIYTDPNPLSSVISAGMFRNLGQKQYEIKDHLGNVHVVITDMKLGVDDGTYIGGVKQNSTQDGIIDFYQADVVSAVDYYAFGSIMPGRNFNSNSYRYGFNGKENDNEVKGTGNQQDYGLRIYDPRLGKFLSVDPLSKEFPWYTPYQFAGNKPILATDLDGAEENPTNNGTTTVGTPNTNPNFENAPEKSIDDFTGEYNKDFGRAGPDAVNKASQTQFKGSNISFVPNAGALNGKQGEYMWEKNAAGTNANQSGGNNNMQTLPMIPALLTFQSSLPNVQSLWVQVTPPPIIQNINAGQIGFGGGQWNILPGANPVLQRVSNILNNNPTSSVRIIGNALMNFGSTNASMSTGGVSFGQLKQNRANTVMGTLLAGNPSFGGRLSTRITPAGSNAQSIMFQVRTPNPQPMRWTLVPIN